MSRTPEQTFYDWLKRNFKWFWQRIETATASGVPDILAMHKGVVLIIETKALPQTNVQLRKAQYAWIAKAYYSNVRVWVFNRNPKRPNKIQAWHAPFKVKPGKKDHVKIISDPDINLHKDEFADLDINNFK